MKISSINRQEVTILGKSDLKRPVKDGAVGIEIELEGVDYRDTTFKHWRVVHDGSLQGGVEFVSRPVCGSAITEALDEIKKYLSRRKPYISFRTSVHVHVNMLDTTTDELIKMVELYLLYEPVLFRLHEGWNRYDNIFCVPARKSYAIQEGYASLIRDLNQNTLHDAYVGYKYSAMNPNPLSTFGTLEFRHMGGSKDTKEILDWVDVLLQLKKAATNKNVDIYNPVEVFEKIEKRLDIAEEDLFSGRQILESIQLINSGV